MRNWTDEDLAPFMALTGPLEATSYSGNYTAEAWRQLAIVLAEESADTAHARRIVESFVRHPRYDEKGQLRTDIPSSIELRMWARGIPADEKLIREFKETRRADGSIAAPGSFPGCGKCDFSGWRPVERNGYDFSEPCECRGNAAPPVHDKRGPGKMTPAAEAIEARIKRAAGDL